MDDVEQIMKKIYRCKNNISILFKKHRKLADKIQRGHFYKF